MLVADAEADNEEAADADVQVDDVVTPEWRASERAINTPRAPTASG